MTKENNGYGKMTEEEMNYYNERITIKLASDIFTYSNREKV
jgi:hypothetical protein